MLDAIIIGAGPAGIAVAETFQREGLRCRIYEKGPIAAHIAQYPNFMRFFSTADNLEIARFPLGIVEDKPTRQEYLRYLRDFTKYHALDVETYAEVTAVQVRADGVFEVTVERQGRRPDIIEAATVVVAVGAWDQARRLGVPGDELPKVRYRFTETHEYVGKRVLVVGGRNSSVEAALLLWRAGAEVALSYRRNEFNGVGLKYWLRPDIENRIKNGEIEGYLGTTVERIDWETVTLRREDGGRVVIPNDFVLAHLGYDPPVAFLNSLGIRTESGTNRPEHDPETLETNIPGMFVAGVITYGNVSGHVFIENSRHHGEMMLPRIRQIVGQAQSKP